MADSTAPVDLQPVQLSVSQGLGAGWVCSVGHRLLRVVAVQVNLQQDSDVHKNLQESTDGELERGLIQDEVNSLERVPTGPHQHHLDTERQKRREDYLLRRTWLVIRPAVPEDPTYFSKGLYSTVGLPSTRADSVPIQDVQHYTWKGGSNSLPHKLQHSYLSNYSSKCLWL